MKEKVLVFGATGMLGTAFMPLLKEKYEGVGFNHQEADITDEKKVSALVQEIKPKWVANLAAYTHVDGCETQVEQAFQVNRDGARNVALATQKIPGAKMIHVSTDFVFDGTKTAPYTESDPVNPQCIYAKSKEGGEKGVWELLSPDRALIVRTSWVFGMAGKNFVDTMLKLGKEKKELKVVTDQVGCPTYTRDLAQAILNLMEVNALGWVHFANSGSCSWNEFAKGIFQFAGFNGVQVGDVTSVEFKRPAKRPAYSVLSTDRYEKLTGKPIRPWQEALQDYLKER